MNKIGTFKIKPPSDILTILKGYVIDPENEHVVIVRHNSIEYCTYSDEEFQLESDAQLNIPIKTAILVKNDYWTLEKILLITSDFRITLVEYEDEMPNSIDLFDLFKQNVRPYSHEISYATVHNLILLSIYPWSIFVIDLNDTLSVTEVFITGMDINFIHIFDNNLYIFGKDKSLYSPNFLSCFREYNNKHVDDLFHPVSNSCQVLSIYQNKLYGINGTKISEYTIGPELKFEKVIIEDSKFKKLLNSQYFITSGGNIIHLRDGKAISYANNDVEKMFEINDNEFVVRKRLDRFVLLSNGKVKDLEIQEARYRAVISLPHTVSKNDSVIVASSNNIEKYGIGIPFDVDSCVSAEAERIFIVGDAILISAEQTTAVAGTLDWIDFSKKTISISKIIQATPNGLISNTGQHLDIMVQHASVFENRVAITEPDKKQVTVYEFNGTFCKVLEKSIEGEPSAVFLNDKLYVACWNSNSVKVFEGDYQKILESPIKDLYVIRSIIESNNIVWVGTSRGDLLAFKDEKSYHKRLSSIPIILHPYKEGVFVCSEISGIAVMNEDIDFYPVTKYTISASIDDDTAAILTQSELMIGTLQKPQMIQIASSEFMGDMIGIAAINNEEIASLFYTDKAVLTIAESRTLKEKNKIQFEKGYPLGISATTIDGHLLVAILLQNEEMCSILLLEISKSAIETISTCNILDATALSFCGQYLMTCASSVPVSIPIITNEDGTKLIFGTPLKKEFEQMAVSSISTYQDKALYVDTFLSATVYTSNPLAMDCRDYAGRTAVSGAIGSESIIIGDSFGGLALFVKSGASLKNLAKFNLGEVLADIVPFRLSHCIDGIGETYLGVGASGGIYAIFVTNDNFGYDTNNTPIRTFYFVGEAYNSFEMTIRPDENESPVSQLLELIELDSA